MYKIILAFVLVAAIFGMAGYASNALVYYDMDQQDRKSADIRIPFVVGRSVMADKWNYEYRICLYRVSSIHLVSYSRY